MKKFFGAFLLLLFAFTGCSLFDTPEGIAELSPSSIHTRTERPSANEEVVYCSADVKITNTSDKTIYNCTVTAVAKSDTGIDHYISLSYDVNLPPFQSMYVTVEWSLVRQIETKTETTTETSSQASTVTSVTDAHTTTSTTTTTTNTSSYTSEPKSTETKTESPEAKTTTTTAPSSSTTVSTTTTTTSISASNDETDWNKNSIRIVDCFFN